MLLTSSPLQLATHPLAPPSIQPSIQPSIRPLTQPDTPATTQQAGAPALVLDACVLMSGLLRPLLLNLGRAGILIPLWTDKIGQEWQRNAARLWPIAPALLEKEWHTMQDQFPRANMGDVTAFEVDLRHTDRKDKHVAAAGIAGVVRAVSGSVSILTWNIKDFSRSELRKQQLGLMDPDRLLSQWWPNHTEVLKEQIDLTIAELFHSGRRQSEPFVNMLRRDRLFRLAGCYERLTGPALPDNTLMR